MNVISRKSLFLFALACGMFFTNSLAMLSKTSNVRGTFVQGCLIRLERVKGIGTLNVDKDELGSIFEAKIRPLKEKILSSNKDNFSADENAFLQNELDKIENNLRSDPFNKTSENIYAIIKLKKGLFLNTLKIGLNRPVASSYYKPNKPNFFQRHKEEFKDLVEKFKLQEKGKKEKYIADFVKAMHNKALEFTRSLKMTDKRLAIVTRLMNEFFRPESEKIAIKQQAIVNYEILYYNKVCVDILKNTMTKNPISVEEANNQMLKEKEAFLQKPRIQFENDGYFQGYCEKITAIQAYYQNNSAKPELIDVVISMQSNVIINQLKAVFKKTADIFRAYKPIIEQFMRELNFENYQTIPQEYFAEFFQRTQGIPEKVQENYQEFFPENESVDDFSVLDCVSLDLE